MPKFRIENTLTGVDLGIYEAADETGALDALARSAGYADHAAARAAAPTVDGELSVTRFERYWLTIDPLRTPLDVLSIEELTAVGVRAIKLDVVPSASMSEDDLVVCVLLFEDSPEGVADRAAYAARLGVDYDLDAEEESEGEEEDEEDGD